MRRDRESFWHRHQKGDGEYWPSPTLPHPPSSLGNPDFLSPCLRIDFLIQWHPTPILLPGKSHGRRSLVGCSPWGREESDMTERLHFHFSLSCIGEGSGNPLLCSCLENPRDGGASWAAVYGVAQSQTRLKWLSSSSSSMLPRERGVVFIHNHFLLLRGMIPKFLRQHSLLTLILRASDPGAPSNSWRRLWHSQEPGQPFAS